MTISSTNRQAGPFTGNGVTVAFPFAFKVFSAADVQVVQALTISGFETVKALTTDYSVSLNYDQDIAPGGTVTMVVAPPVGYDLTLTSQLENLQPVDLTNLGGFYPAVINKALDRLTILVQQIARSVGKVSITAADISRALGFTPGPGGSESIYSKEKVTVSSGQTVVTLSALTYNVGRSGSLSVYLNGIRVDDYTETSPSSVTFNSPLFAGDEVTFVVGSEVSATVVGLTGPQGPQGIQGIQGIQGVAGAGVTPQAVGFTLSGGTSPKTATVVKDGTVAMTSDITGGGLAGSFTSVTSAGAIVGTASGVRLPTNGPLYLNSGFTSYIQEVSAGVIQVVSPNGASVLGGLTVNSTALLGYGTGAGGTVTQATSKATSVTLNKPCGQITMHNAALASNTSTSFYCANTVVGAACGIAVTIGGGVANMNNYQFTTYATAGGFQLSVRNISAGSLSEAIVLNFAIFGVATA